MNPLKLASRAYVNFGGSGDTYEAFRDDDQRDADEAMRAALLALADADLKGPYLLVNEAFKSMLRSIANEGNTDV